MTRLICGLIILSATFGCQNKTDSSTVFERLNASETGINFSNDLHYQPLQNIIEYLYFYNGGGVAIGDINNDGLEDVFFTANQQPNKLFLNRGGFKFEDISKQSGISTESDWSTGVTMADVNGDGWLDLYVCAVGNYKSFNGRNKLYINNGNNTFREMAADFGIDFSGFSTQASFFDFDRDGDLDMYLLNHSVHTPRSYRLAETRVEFDSLSGDRLFENLINEGQPLFRDVTRESGIFSSSQGFGLGLITTDINQDGWIDIYVGNDFHENDYLYLNQGDGTFKESLEEFIGHTSRFSMGADVFDLNEDNQMDLITLDMLPGDPTILMKSGGEDNNQIADIKSDYGYAAQYARNAIQLNKGNGSFAEIGHLIDAYATDWSWSVLIQDFDMDGMSDFYITNGIYRRPNDLDYINYLSNISFEGKSGKALEQLKKELIQRMPTMKLPNYVFSRQGEWTYKETTEKWGLNEPSYSNGSAYGDLDNDGDLDLVVNNVNQEAFIYRNDISNNNYLVVELRSNAIANTYGIGATLELFSGGKSWTRQITATRGFQSSSTTRAHFGLGKMNQLDSLVVKWPDGSYQVVRNLVVNERLTLEQESQGVTSSEPPTIFRSSNIEISHREDNFSDYKVEALIPKKFSTQGPAFASGDLDADGELEYFLGGAHGVAAQIFNYAGNSVTPVPQPALSKDMRYEDVSAQFADIDGDGDIDLYVVSGGGRYPQGTPAQEDRIYLNDGTGKLERWNVALPRTNGGVVRLLDFDQDGQIEIFVGSRSVPGSYGFTPVSYLLKVGSRGISILKEMSLGMVSDAAWADLTGDGLVDLVVAGDWMPLTILINDGNGKLVDHTADFGMEGTAGWWNVVKVQDMDGDGRQDLIAGNLGYNSRLKPNKERPVKLFLGDFDGNSQLDPIIFYTLDDQYVPLATRDELITQLPFIKKSFSTYSEFAEVRSFEKLIKSEPLETKDFHETGSAVFLNKGSNFKKVTLPIEAQLSPIQDFHVEDIDKDGHLDLLVVGNSFEPYSQLGKMDANAGCVLLGTGSGTFDFKRWLPLTNNVEFRAIERISAGKYLVVPNNDSLIIMRPFE